MENHIRIALTMDVEPNVFKINLKTGEKYSGLTIIMTKILDIFEKYEVLGTWFITHDYWSKIDCEFPSLVEKMSENGEIGCHVHFRREKEEYYSDYDFQMELIDRATNSLRVQGYNVQSFRGGNYFFDENTLKILEELNYQIDSSVVPGMHYKLYPDLLINHKRCLCNRPYFPSYDNHCIPGSSDILEIPLSVYPYYDLHNRLVSVYIGDVLHMTEPAKDLLNNIKKIIKKWGDKRNIPVIVLTAHPWDFVFCTKKKIDNLEKFIIQIQNQMKVEFLTLSEIKKHFIERTYEFKRPPIIITKSDFLRRGPAIKFLSMLFSRAISWIHSNRNVKNEAK